MKKLISVVLSLLMIFNFGILAVNAAEVEAATAASCVTAKAGEKVEVYFSIDAPDGIKVLSFLDFEYDNTVLTVVQGECAWLADGILKDIDFANNASAIAFTENEALSGDVLKFVFTVAEDAADGSYPINYKVIAKKMIDNVETEISVSVEPGEIYVGEVINSLSDFDYELGADGIIILGYTGTAKNVIIAESYEIDGTSYDVVEIAESAFEGNGDIKSVVIPATVETIGDAAFYDCLSLTEVTVLGKNTEIGEVALGWYYISRREDGIVEGFKIYGYEGSTAEAYADENEMTFVALEEEGCAHNYESEVTTAATCNATGVETFTCTECGDTYTEEIAIDASNHAGGTEVRDAVDADCGNDGYTGDTYCLGCNTKIEDGEVDPATGKHGYVGVDVTEATCISTGLEVFVCETCQDEIEKELEIDPDNHTGDTYFENVSSADCGNDGYTGDEYCADCDALINAGTVSPATGEHDYVSVVTTAATCNAKGVETFTCTVCGDSYTKEIEIDAGNHAGGTEIRDAKAEDCGNDGYSGDTYCLGCNTKIADGEAIPATGKHNYESNVTTAATCNAKGVMTYTCTVCNDTYTEEIEIDADNHVGGTEVRDAVAEDCGNDGYSGDTYCLGCNTKLADGEAIPATGKHNYESNVTTAATCNSKGVETFTCTVCNDTYTEEIEIDATNHAGGTEVRDASTGNCGEAGYTGDTYCLGCNTMLEKGTDIDPDENHAYGSAVTKAATCNEKGIETFTCTVCGDSYTKEIEIDAGNHAGGTEIRDAKAEDCGNDGYTGNTYCLGCNTKLADGEAIPATGKHNYESNVTTAATCNAKGVMTYTCTVCNDTYTEEIEIDAGNHAGGTEVRDAKAEDCGNDGYTGDTYCLGCNTKLADGEAIPATGKHDYIAVATKSATCNEKGVMTHTCTVCADEYTSEIAIDADNHASDTEIRDAKAADCGNAGYTGDTYCLGCNTKLADGEAIPATGKHNYESNVTTAATCNATGVETFTCTVCNDTYTEEIAKDASNHVGGTEVRGAKDADCGNAGYTGDTYCLGCNTKIADGEDIPATGKHNYEGNVTTAATCNAKGVMTYTCTVCNDTYTEEIAKDATNHAGGTEIRDAADADCGNAGYTGDTYCLGCDTKLADGEDIPATGKHNYEGNVTTPATCNATGVETFTCTVCNASYTEEIAKDATNHAGGREIRDAVAADCGNNGYSGDTYCLGCNTKIADGEDIPATGKHNYEGNVTTAATCNATGVETFTCTVCNDTYTEEIAKDSSNHVGGTEIRDAADADCGNNGYTGDTYCLGCNTKIADGEDIPATGKHNYASEVTATATCKDAGVITYTCTVCNDTYTEETAKDADNHAGGTEVRDAADANCSDDGYTGDTYCLGCNTKIADGEAIPATGKHTYVSVETTKATCNATGVMTYTCEACFDSYDEEIAIDASNHAGDTEVRDAKAEDCGNDGYSGDTYCLGCNTKIADGSVIPATGNHNFEVVSVEYEGSEGIITYRCTVCGAEKTEKSEFNAEDVLNIMKEAEELLNSDTVTEEDKEELEKAYNAYVEFVSKYVEFDENGNLVKNNMPVDDEKVMTEYYELYSALRTAVDNGDPVKELISSITNIINFLKKLIKFLILMHVFFDKF